jgi:lipoate-protein ligase B
MDDETRQPKQTEDYMQMIMTALGVNTLHDAWLAVERLKQARLVWVAEGDKLAFAAGIKVRAWQEITNMILKMVDETVIK